MTRPSLASARGTFPAHPAFDGDAKRLPVVDRSWRTNRDAESRFLEYAKQLQYLADPPDSQLSEKEEEAKPFRYVRTFSAEQKARTASEMDKEELQAYINNLLGAKGSDGAIKNGAPN